MLEFRALFEPADEGGFVITFPDFCWGVTQGDDEEEGQQIAVDALAMIVNDYIERGERIPTPLNVRGRKYRAIRLPAIQEAKTLLYQAFTDSGLRKAELARRLGIAKTNVDRLFDLHHHTRLDQLEAAFRALGKELTINVRDAA